MAGRRMLSKRVTGSARFLKMPPSVQALYFHFCIEADDDGVVEAYPIMRMLGSTEDDVRILCAKQLITVLNEDLVTHISDWLEHNFIRADRKIDSVYKDLLLQLVPEAEIIEPKPRSDVKDNSKRVNGPSTDGIGKDRLGKDRLGKGCDASVAPPVEELSYEVEESSGVSAIPKKTPRAFLNSRRAVRGKPPMEKRSSAYVTRSLLVDFFKETVNHENGTEYYTHPDDVKDIGKENTKISVLLKNFFERCDSDMEKAKDVIRFFSGEYGSFCGWKPSMCFRKETVQDYENRDKGKKSNQQQVFSV